MGDRGADRDADHGDAPPAQVERPDRLADALADLDGHGAGRVAQEDRELLAAIAGRDVVFADGRDDRPGDRPQDLVADLVPVAIVEALELVDVDHQDADGILRPATAGEERAELVEVTPVREPGECVGRGAGFGLAMRVHPGEGGRRLDRSAGQQAMGRIRPVAGRPAGDEQCADHPAVGGQRRDEGVPQAEDRSSPAGDPFRDQLVMIEGVAAAGVSASCPRTGEHLRDGRCGHRRHSPAASLPGGSCEGNRCATARERFRDPDSRGRGRGLNLDRDRDRLAPGRAGR